MRSFVNSFLFTCLAPNSRQINQKLLHDDNKRNRYATASKENITAIKNLYIPNGYCTSFLLVSIRWDV